jgi:hypothetical protein
LLEKMKTLQTRLDEIILQKGFGKT